MNLQIRATDNRTLVLTTEDGKPLPGQRSVAWDHSGRGELGDLTVVFIVDGEEISLSHDPISKPTGSLPEASAAFAALSPENRARFLVMYDLHTRPVSPVSLEASFKQAADAVRAFSQAMHARRQVDRRHLMSGLAACGVVDEADAASAVIVGAEPKD